MEGSADPTPLSILMTTDTVGGVWSYSVELCKALQLFNVHFYLITTGALMQPAQKQELENLENVTVYETDFLLEWMDDPWQNIDASAAWLLRLEQELAPDLIHINGYAYSSLPWKAPVMVVAHSDVFSWWLSVKDTYPPAKWNQYYERVRNGLQHANCIIAPSSTMMKYIRDIYAIATYGQVIYNARSAVTFSPSKKLSCIFSMGRIWDEAKNIQLLIEAAPLIRYPIKLAGDNSFAGNNVDTDKTNITYLGKLPIHEIAAQLSEASIYVLPARYEPFGLSVLEAALSGCALVLGAIGSLQEIWGDAAIYTDTCDAHALAGTVNFLMENNTVRIQYARKAVERAMKYTTPVMAKSYMQVYGRMLQEKRYLPQQEIM